MFEEDELTPEEQAALDSLEGKEPSSGETETDAVEPSTVENQGEAGTGESAKPSDATEQPGDDDFDSWRAQHADKSPEELLSLAFSQQKRANAAGYAARQTQEEARRNSEALDKIRARAREMAEEKRKKLEEDRKAFDEALENDPDAAARMLADRTLGQEQARIDAELEMQERQFRIDDAVAKAAPLIPRIEERAVAMHSLAMELGYSKDEVDAIDDHRQLIVLSLAEAAVRHMRSGVMNVDGTLNLEKLTGETAPRDPRLKAPSPHATAGNGGGGPSATPSRDSTLQDLLMMSDDDLAKLSAADFEKLLG